MYLYMESFHCELCNIQFKSKRCLTAHKKSQRHNKRVTNDFGIQYKCGCGKYYAHRQSLFNHRKTCQVNHDNNNIIKEPPNEIYELREQIRILKEKLLKNNAINTVHTNTRRGIYPRIRKEIISEQNNKCNMCIKPLTEFNVNIDHKIGVQFGGTNDIDNLQALCLECHNEKTIKEKRKRKKIFDAIQQILSE